MDKNNKIFTDVYRKLIMQEEYNPEGINTSAIAAVMKGMTERWPGSPHPVDQQWFIPNSVDLNQVGIDDWDTYTKIVDDIGLCSSDIVIECCLGTCQERYVTCDICVFIFYLFY